MEEKITSGWRSGSYRPLVPPGNYEATVTIQGTKHSVPIEVRADPRLDTDEVAYQDQFERLNYLNGLLSQVHELINESTKIQDQLADLKRKMKSSDEHSYADALKEIVSASEKLQVMQNEFKRPPPNMGYRQRPRLREEIRSLMFAIGNAPSKPTASQLERVVSLQEETSSAVNEFQEFVSRDIERINQLAGPMPQVTYKKFKP